MQDSDQLEYAILAFLRPSDDFKVVLEVTIPESEHDVVDDASDSEVPVRNRILAVVVHKNEGEGHEEGCIFVLKSKATSSDLDIYRLYPIFGNFAITMSQTRRTTFDFQTHGPASTSSVDQLRSELSLTIYPGSGNQEPLTLLTHDIQRLRSVLDECKRLKDAADANVESMNPETAYAWLKPYALRRISSSAVFSSTPQDLRKARQPLHTRLSPACAGDAGDELDDIELIRDDWLRRTARQVAGGTTSLKIRLGTFNVNGRLPSQDLSSWVGGRPRDEKANATQVQPLTVSSSLNGNVLKNPTDAAGQADDSQSIMSEATTIAESVTSTATVTTAFSNISSARVDTTDPEDPDILVLGFQEVDLSTEALLYSASTAREDAWCLAIFAGLGEKRDSYEKLASKQLVGMLIIILVKKVLKGCFHDVQSSVVGLGIMGMMGNKGGTAIRLKFSPPPSEAVPTPALTTFTFVNSHLAAFDEMVDKRNNDFHELSRRHEFPLENEIINEDEDPFWLTPLSVYDSDVLFWMGDLNYRIDLPDGDIRHILESEEWTNKFKDMSNFDQLNNAKLNNRAFTNFSEAPINHLPTYRFSPGVPTDSLGYDLKRKPAWTDRILFYPDMLARVKPLEYGSHPDVTMSDHRPVSAEFSVQVDSFDAEVYDSTLHRSFDKFADLAEMSHGINVVIEPKALKLGKVSYRRPMTRTLKIRNLGKFPCAYRFVPTELNVAVHPTWLRIDPMTGVLRPKDAVSINIMILVDNAAAQQLNLGPRQIEYTLILHTSFGKDHFIAVSGEYDYTSFANRLSTLIRLPGPISSLQNSTDLLSQNRTINAPREVIRLVDWLMTNGVDVDDAFISPGKESMVDRIRECLDSGDEFPFSPSTDDPAIILAFGSTLLQLLDTLVEPVVPAALHSRCAQVTSRDEAFELLNEYPQESVNVWISVTSFLHFISQRPSDNTSSKAKRLAAVFAPVLLRDDPRSVPPISPVAKRDFLLCFLD